MNACPEIEKCTFFAERMEKSPMLASLYRARYCLKFFAECERYRVIQILASKAKFESLLADENEQEKEKTPIRP